MLPTYEADSPKSYYNLIINVYGGIVIPWFDGTPNKNVDTILFNQPLSFFRSGYYNWESASRYGRDSYGDYWESRIYSATNSNNLNFNSTNLNPQNGNNRGNGFSVRCVSALTR